MRAILARVADPVGGSEGPQALSPLCCRQGSWFGASVIRVVHAAVPMLGLPLGTGHRADSLKQKVGSLALKGQPF